MEHDIRQPGILQRRQQRWFLEHVDRYHVRSKQEKGRSVVFRVGNYVLEGRRQRTVHNVTDRVGKRRVLNGFLQKVEHRLQQSCSLGQAGDAGHWFRRVGHRMTGRGRGRRRIHIHRLGFRLVRAGRRLVIGGRAGSLTVGSAGWRTNFIRLFFAASLNFRLEPVDEDLQTSVRLLGEKQKKK